MTCECECAFFAVDELDTESEIGDGDKVSLRSFQSSQQLTEEELAKVRVCDV